MYGVGGGSEIQECFRLCSFSRVSSECSRVAGCNQSALEDSKSLETCVMLDGKPRQEVLLATRFIHLDLKC